MVGYCASGGDEKTPKVKTATTLEGCEDEDEEFACVVDGQCRARLCG